MKKQTKQNEKSEVVRVDLTKEKGIVFIFDSETIGKPKVRNSVLPFDNGIVVFDLKSGKILETKSFINKNIFRDKEDRATIFYQNTLPKYEKEIKKNKEEFFELSAYSCLVELNKLWKKYNPKYWGAYNSDFDSNALANLYKKFPRLKNPFTQDKEIDIQVCVMNTLRDFKELKNSYRLHCHALGLYSESKKNYSISADSWAKFRFSPTLVEDHMGLSDAKLECNILEDLIELYKENKVPFVVEIGQRWQNIRYDFYIREQVLRPFTQAEYLKEIIDNSLANTRKNNHRGLLEALRLEKAKMLVLK